MPEAATGSQSRIRLRRIGRDLFRACVPTLALALVHPASGQTDARVDEFFASVNKSITDVAGQAEPQASIICHRVVASLLNMDAIVRGALASSRLPLSPQQRAAYHAAAVRWAVRDCVRRNGDNRGTPLELVGIRSGDAGERIVATRSAQPAHTAIWRLRGTGRLQAVDVVIDGRSMVLSLRDETNALLDRYGNDIDKALAALGR